MKYVKCKECKGYYILKEGEYADEFGNCQCGGELEYIETHSENLDKKPEKHEEKTDEINGGYLLCHDCHGYYVLQKGEFLDDFLNCQCGGNLEYIKTHQEVLNKVSSEGKEDKNDDYDYLNNQGLSLYHEQKYSEAIKLYDNALKINPDFPEALNNKGNATIQVIKNMKSMDKIKGYKKALSCYNKALELEPSNLDILNNKALALAYLGDYENSYKILNQVVQDNPSDLGSKIKMKKVSKIIVEEFTDKGYDKLINGNYTEAIKYFNKILEIKPDNIDVLMYKGGALFATRNYQEAIKCFDVVIYTRSDNSIAWFSKGETLERLKNYKEAEKCFRKVMEIVSKRRGNLPAESISTILNMDLMADTQKHIEKCRKTSEPKEK